MIDSFHDIEFLGKAFTPHLKRSLETLLADEPHFYNLAIHPPGKTCFDLYKDGHHCLTFSKTGWNFVVKLLKEEDRENTLLKRHLNALDLLGGLVATFGVFRKNGTSIVIQEKLPMLLDDRLRDLIGRDALDDARGLVTDYMELNLKTWQKGMFDWHFRIDHAGLDSQGKPVLFDIGGVRGKPNSKERIKWRLGYFRRKHQKNIQILNAIHPGLAEHYKSRAFKELGRKVAEEAILKFHATGNVCLH